MRGMSGTGMVSRICLGNIFRRRKHRTRKMSRRMGTHMNCNTEARCRPMGRLKKQNDN